MINPPYIVQSPVLFLVFNRPENTGRVFQEIKAAQPARLFIAADGPRANHPEDIVNCQMVREIVSDITWDCDVKTLFREANQGCKMAVSDGISWFFNQVEEGIILEDDCLPAPSFFYFCDQMLEYYRFRENVFSIAGYSDQAEPGPGHESYYFSQLSHIWGWASWRRVWKMYDRDLLNYDQAQATAYFTENFRDPLLIQYWLDIFQRLKNNRIDTWDHQFQFLTFFKQGLCVTPYMNLIRNIGVGPGATHTLDAGTQITNQSVGEIKHIVHPNQMMANKTADYVFFNKEFRLDEKRRALEKDKLPRRRLKKWLRGLFYKKI